MEIREILYINKIAECKNFTKAANELHITQPSLSQSIKAVESRIGIQLFIRTKRGVELTESGKRFIKDTADIIHEYNLFLSKLKHYSDVGKTHYIGLYKLSYTTPINDAIMNFISNNSKDNYIIKVENIIDLEKMLEKNKIDLAVIKYTPLFKRSAHLVYEVLLREKLHVMINKNNPLSIKQQLTIADLEGMKLITSAKNEYPYAMIDAILKASGVELEILISTNYANMTMITEFIEKDLGITFATLDVCKYYSNSNIHYIPLSPAFYYEICIVQNQDNINNQDNQTLIEHIKEFLQSK